MTGNTDMHLLVTDTFKKRVGARIRKFASYSVTHGLCIELIRLLIVACGMLSHSSMAVQSCWILAGTGTRRHTHCCLSGEYAGHGRTGTFSASRNCVQILIMLKHQDLVMVSLCIQIAIDKMQLFSMSVAYACLPIP
jgi:hypothetical protein